MYNSPHPLHIEITNNLPFLRNENVASMFINCANYLSFYPSSISVVSNGFEGIVY